MLQCEDFKLKEIAGYVDKTMILLTEFL